MITKKRKKNKKLSVRHWDLFFLPVASHYCHLRNEKIKPEQACD